LEGDKDTGFPFAHHGAGLHPGRVDIGEVKRVEELSAGRVTGVGDQVHLDEARTLDIPVVGLDGDVMLEESSGLGAAVDAPLELLFSVLEAAVDGAGAYAEQFLFDFRCQGGSVV